ncbi:MAG: YggS family pyridoxal phosphate-dependent enzyme, partial [Verrucomicrobiae bacterium]|nr:YggS family pyridoxal phosphate-dependent enzyme [Verrucomicrobiae bacterium]
SEEVKLMAVTKRFPLQIAAEAYACGLTLLGENRVQEGVEKISQANFPARWELIGHLQSNKAQLAVQYFDRIQSVDSLKLANRLGRFARESGKTIPILLQINTGHDPGKFGMEVQDVDSLLEEVLKLESVQVEGFMTIAPLPPQSDTAKKAFEDLRLLRDRLSESFGRNFPELSMGMSFDLEAAIEAGSTCIRVGTGIFGERPV